MQVMCIEKHGRGVEQAQGMVDTFASLGVNAFDVTETDIDGHKQVFRRDQMVEQLQQWMPRLMESAIGHQYNIIARPKGATVELVQLDDLSPAGLERVKTSAFLILATSPENYQAWVAVRECDADLARRLRRGIGADPSASGASRVAGSLNFKRKYAPNFPIVEILGAAPKRTVTQTELEAQGLVAAPDRILAKPLGRSFQGRGAKQWPSYERCLQNAPPAHHSDRPDVSRADFTFCLLAIDWGWSVADTCARLLKESSKAHENGETYAWLTAQRAAAAIARRQRG
jgi:RepB DNA-primase from phage plasmid